MHIDLLNPVTIICYFFEYWTAFVLKLRPVTVKCCVSCGTQLYLHEKFLVINDTSVQVLLHLLMKSLRRVFFQVSVSGIGRVGIEIEFFAEFMFLFFKSVSDEKFWHFSGIHIYIYRGADKSLAWIDNSYMKIEHISCLSCLYRFLRVCSKRTIDSVLRHRELDRAKELSAPRYMQPETFFGAWYVEWI